MPPTAEGGKFLTDFRLSDKSARQQHKPIISAKGGKKIFGFLAS